MSISSTTYSPTAPPARRRPSVGWYWAAGLLLVAGFVVAAAWLVGAVIGLDDHVDQFPRTSVPGEISVPIDNPTRTTSTTRAPRTSRWTGSV